MSKFKFAACEWAFPCWGELAIKMAHDAGFQGVQLGDGGASLHSYPLRSKRVQEYYLNLGAKYDIEFPQIHLYTDVYKRQPLSFSRPEALSQTTPSLIQKRRRSA